MPPIKYLMGGAGEDLPGMKGVPPPSPGEILYYWVPPWDFGTPLEIFLARTKKRSEIVEISPFRLRTKNHFYGALIYWKGVQDLNTSNHWKKWKVIETYTKNPKNRILLGGGPPCPPLIPSLPRPPPKIFMHPQICNITKLFRLPKIRLAIENKNNYLKNGN